jgi:hypothetical protein
MSYRSGNHIAKLIALPLVTGATGSHTKLAERAKGMNILAYCNSNIRSEIMPAIIAPRISALIALVQKDYEEGGRTAQFTSFHRILVSN